jgi:hypothetical protein
MRIIFIAFIFLLILGCASPVRFNPYIHEALSNFPLGLATKDDVLSQNGNPTREIVLPNGKNALVYEFKVGEHLRTFTVELAPNTQVDNVYYEREGFAGEKENARALIIEKSRLYKSLY